jgi:hypothetical protein
MSLFLGESVGANQRSLLSGTVSQAGGTGTYPTGSGHADHPGAVP